MTASSGFSNALHIKEFKRGMRIQTPELPLTVECVESVSGDAYCRHSSGMIVRVRHENISKAVLDLDSVWEEREYTHKEGHNKVMVRMVSDVLISVEGFSGPWTITREEFLRDWRPDDDPPCPIPPVRVGDLVCASDERNTAYGPVQIVDEKSHKFGVYTGAPLLVAFDWDTAKITRLEERK